MSRAFILTITIIAAICFCLSWFWLPGWLVWTLFATFAVGVVMLLAMSDLRRRQNLAEPPDTVTETLVFMLTGSRAEVERQMDELCRLNAQFEKDGEKKEGK